MAEHECTCTNCGGRDHCKIKFEPSRKCCCFWKPELKPIWIPCSERLPEHYNEILFCERDRTIHKGYMYWDGTFIENHVKLRKSDIVAWMPMPDAYEPPESEVQE